MLWYKAWLETRSRFLTCLATLTIFCTVFVHHAQGLLRSEWSADFSRLLFVTQQFVVIIWVLAVVLLGMGGIVREKASGTSLITLSLPVSRARLLGVRVVHHGLRLHPCALDHHALGAGLRHRGADQGGNRTRLDCDRDHPVAAIAEGACAAVAVAASRGRARAGAGGNTAARGRGHAASLAENGRDRPVDRWCRARRQQFAHHHQRQSGDRRPQSPGLGRVVARAADARDRQCCERRPARGDADLAAPGFCAAPAA